MTDRQARTRPVGHCVDSCSAPTMRPAGGAPVVPRPPCDRERSRQRRGQRLEIVERIDVAGLAVANQIGRAADGVADHARQPGRERFVDDQPPRFRDTSLGSTRQSASAYASPSSLWFMKPEHLQIDAQPRGFGAHFAFERTRADDHDQRRRRVRARRRRARGCSGRFDATSLPTNSGDERVRQRCPRRLRAAARASGSAVTARPPRRTCRCRRACGTLEDAVFGDAERAQVFRRREGPATGNRRTGAAAKRVLTVHSGALPAAGPLQQMRVAAIQRRHAEAAAREQRADQRHRIPAGDQHDVGRGGGDRVADFRHIEAGEMAAVDAVARLGRPAR